MRYEFASSEKIGDIVTRMPKASDVFKDFQIDFCCGGSRPLIEAIKEKGLDEKEVLEKLQEVYEEVKDLQRDDTDWTRASFTDLVDHIVNTHHAFLYRELPRVSEFVTKIYRVHGLSHSELGDVFKLFHTLKMELESHLIKEEELVFPLIKEYEANPSEELLEKTLKVIDELESEHDEAGTILKELRRITDNYTVPSDGCKTYELAFKGIEEVESDTFQHIHLENNIMFPRLAALRK